MAYIIPSHFSNLPYLNTEHTTSWLQFWLKLISFGSNFFYLAKMLATTNSEQGLALKSQLAFHIYHVKYENTLTCKRISRESGEWCFKNSFLFPICIIQKVTILVPK